MLDHLKFHLQGKVIILGIGNTLRSDDGAGSVLASRIKDGVSFLVWDAGLNPENYLNRIIKEKPDSLVIIDAADFGGKAGEFRISEADQIQTSNLFSTHIIVLIIQPKTIALGDTLSPEVSATLNNLQDFFYAQAKQPQ
jgi:hydrogenase 3 maturation protease